MIYPFLLIGLYVLLKPFLPKKILSLMSDNFFEKHFLKMLKFSEKRRDYLLRADLFDRWKSLLIRKKFKTLEEFIFYLRFYPDDLFILKGAEICEDIADDLEKNEDKYDLILEMCQEKDFLEGVVHFAYQMPFLEEISTTDDE